MTSPGVNLTPRAALLAVWECETLVSDVGLEVDDNISEEGIDVGVATEDARLVALAKLYVERCDARTGAEVVLLCFCMLAPRLAALLPALDGGDESLEREPRD